MIEIMTRFCPKYVFVVVDVVKNSKDKSCTSRWKRTVSETHSHIWNAQTSGYYLSHTLVDLQIILIFQHYVL